ncbi:MAG: TonB-dependent receptor, partial [Gammaproteobacteria bacterium]|nr:TonB-dependent receptor [Gammaproteobacteria bacterium]
TTGIFAHMTYDLNDDWTLAVGGRQTSEDRIFHQLEFNSVTGTCLYDDPNNPNNPRSIPGAPPPTGICRPDFALTRDAFTGGFYNNAQASFDEFTPMMSFTRQLEGGDTLDSGSVYFSYSQGFLAGSFNDELNVVREPALAPLVAYGPETVDSYEVGFKGTFQDGQTTLRTALFYMDYQDMQQSVNIDNADGRFGPDSQIEVTSNAANAKIQGFEVELRTQPWDGGFLMVDLAYLDNEFSDYSSFDIVTGGTDDLSGLTIADFSPDWTLNMMVEHQFELANGATITPQLGMYYQSEYDFQGGLLPGERSVCFQDGYTKLRARVTYEPANADWQASLFGSNIGDERYLQICGTARSGVFDYRYGAPSIWGLEFNYRWGS